MSDQPIVISTDSRTARQELITWWDQSKLKSSHVLVVGAGALGNEIVKNLVLVGVGKISIVDMDIIERSNLSRCVFFRESDDGSYKSEVLAREAKRLNPEVETIHYTCSVQELGDGFMEQFDLVIAGLDNREARVWLGGALRRVGKVWIDGAIEGLMGKVQTFVPDGPCYACTMSAKDWEQLAHRRACKLLGTDEILSGHTPTNATTSSIIAGIQTQEAIKYLVGVDPSLRALENKVWRMIGEQMTTFASIVDLDEYCIYHFDEMETKGSFTLPDHASQLWETAGVPTSATFAFYDDFLYINGCSSCKTEPQIGFKDLLKKQGTCPTCKEELIVDLSSRISIGDKAAQCAIKKEFWPKSALIEVRHEDGSIDRYQVERERD